MFKRVVIRTGGRKTKGNARPVKIKKENSDKPKKP